MAAIAVTVSSRNVLASTIVNGARTIADAAVIVTANAVVQVVTEAVAVEVSRAVSAADTEGVELVAFAVTVPGGDVFTPTVVDRAGSITGPASVIVADAVVDVVAEPVAV